MKKDIYIIKNSINSKVYIGQAKDAAERWMQHIYDSRYEAKIDKQKQLIHKAISKYGYDKFHYEILESQIENYDEREKYWISYYNSQAPNGYNIAPGGSGCGYGLESVNAVFNEDMLMKCISEISSTKKTFANIAKKYGCTPEVISAINLGYRYAIEGFEYPLRSNKYSPELLRQIRYALKYELDMTLKEISDLYRVDHSQVSLINQGKIYYVDGEKYPIRDRRKQDLTPETVDAIIDDIIHSELCMSDIAKKYNVSNSRISGINQGNFYVRDNITYPIRKESDPRNKGYKKFIDRTTILEIHSLLRGSDSVHAIAAQFDVSETTVYNINNGKCKKYVIDGIKYPIRNFNHKHPVSTIHA